MDVWFHSGSSCKWSSGQPSRTSKYSSSLYSWTNVVGLTHHLSHLLPTMALLHINKSCHKVSPLMVKAEDVQISLGIPFQVMLKNNLVRKFMSLGNMWTQATTHVGLYDILSQVSELTVRSCNTFVSDCQYI